MTIKSFKTGPGTFTLGTGGSQDVSPQVTKLSVAWAETVNGAGDAVDVLSGEQLPGDEGTVTIEPLFPECWGTLRTGLPHDGCDEAERARGVLQRFTWAVRLQGRQGPALHDGALS